MESTQNCSSFKPRISFLWQHLPPTTQHSHTSKTSIIRSLSRRPSIDDCIIFADVMKINYYLWRGESRFGFTISQFSSSTIFPHKFSSHHGTPDTLYTQISSCDCHFIHFYMSPLPTPSHMVDFNSSALILFFCAQLPWTLNDEEE